MDAKVTALVAELRAKGLPPKAIARQLKLAPAEVAALIREQVAQSASLMDNSTLPAMKACYLSPGWSTGLGLVGDAEAWRVHESAPDGSEGLVCALWARAHRYDKLVVSGCLVDTYCLGVKNAVGPKIMDPEEFHSFGRRYFQSYDAPPIAVPLELLQSLVLGAVEYAASLGLEPHPDFAAVRSSLGAWSGPSSIRFGKDGKPFYIQGPDDDAYRILHALRHHLGDGNFGYVAVAG